MGVWERFLLVGIGSLLPFFVDLGDGFEYYYWFVGSRHCLGKSQGGYWFGFYTAAVTCRFELSAYYEL